MLHSVAINSSRENNKSISFHLEYIFTFTFHRMRKNDTEREREIEWEKRTAEKK